MKRFAYILTLLLTTVLSACHDDADETLRASTLDSIYVTVSVSTAAGSNTRAVPQGGEGGDGWELGSEDFNENTVYDLTVFKINGDQVEGKYIAVEDPKTTNATDHANTYGTVHEYTVKYARGTNVMAPTEGQFLVVANYGPGLEAVTDKATLEDKLSDKALWQGTNPGECDRFLMSSASPSTLAGTHLGSEDDPFLVHVDLQRLAARIDFCNKYDDNTKTAAYGTYNVKNPSDVAVVVKGFKYDMAADCYFLLESITPFNVYNESEYLFRRVQDTWTGTPVTTLLGEETATNYVVDPKTSLKETNSLSYINPLGDTEPVTWSSATGYRTAEDLNGGRKSGNNHVVAYTMENTLRPTSPLKKYATGLVIHGSYYDSANKEIGRKTFYCFLRHQSESTATDVTYDGYEWASIPTGAGKAGTAMNFSIVRNNIYRISIESINPLGGWIKFKVAEHDWRMVTHPTITM